MVNRATREQGRTRAWREGRNLPNLIPALYRSWRMAAATYRCWHSSLYRASLSVQHAAGYCRRTVGWLSSISRQSGINKITRRMGGNIALTHRVQQNANAPHTYALHTCRTGTCCRHLSTSAPAFGVKEHRAASWYSSCGHCRTTLLCTRGCRCHAQNSARALYHLPRTLYSATHARLSLLYASAREEQTCVNGARW